MTSIAAEPDESYVPDCLVHPDRDLDNPGMRSDPRPGDGPHRAAPGR